MNTLNFNDPSMQALSAEEAAKVSGGIATAFGYKSYYMDSSGNTWEDMYFCDFSYMLGSYCMWESDKY